MSSLSRTQSAPLAPAGNRMGRRRSLPTKSDLSEESGAIPIKSFCDFNQNQAGDRASTAGSGVLQALLRRNPEAEKVYRDCHTEGHTEKISPTLYRKPPSQKARPGVGCVGSITWQGALQSPQIRRSSSLVKVSRSDQKVSSFEKRERPPSVESEASTTDSDGNEEKFLSTMENSLQSDSRGSSRPPSRGGSSNGSLDLPEDLPEAECPLRHFEFELTQFKEGKASFGAISGHLQSKDANVRRAVVEAMEAATEYATLETTRAVIKRLSDTDPFVRRASIKTLASVLALGKDLKAADLAQQTLADASACIKFDAVDALLPYAMRGKGRAFDALDWYRSQDKDLSIRLKAERSQVVIAGWSKSSAIRGARVAIARASEALTRSSSASSFHGRRSTAAIGGY